MSIHHIGIIGAGQMGTGIAHVAAQMARVSVSLYDQSSSAVQTSISFIDKMLQKDVSKGKMEDINRKHILDRIHQISSMDQLKDADMIIEAVKEDQSIKTRLFEQLSLITKPTAILASNTSSISITKIAASTNRPEKVE